MGKHSYGLTWINEDELFSVTESSFQKAIADSRAPTKFKTPPDPFTLVAHAILTNYPLKKALQFEPERALNKTLSNNVGLWHQHVLGLANGWVDAGSSGGGVDLRTSPGIVHPHTGTPIFAEVKNRFNTIKSSDEKKLWDSLDIVARSNNATSYVFQIVPQTSNRYDCPWDVSGRTARDHVRCCDGVTAYEMVFGYKNALIELYEVFPALLSDVASKANQIDATEAKGLYYSSLPKV